jgi:hypothetical protein
MSSDEGQQPVYSWGMSVGFALIATAIAVGLIVVFTGLIDWVGEFWSQVIYFPTVFAGVLIAALRSRTKDKADPIRLGGGANPITPAGLPGPFVVTQALGVLGIVMVVSGFALGGSAKLLWTASGFVLLLTGGVGLLFWLSGRPWQRHTA